MRRAALAAVVLWAPLAAGAADALQIAQIEQDIRRLQLQMQEQARQIEALRARLVQPNVLPDARQSSPSSSTPSTTWIDASKWMQVMPGMSELEVIALLGPPTSMRSEGAQRVLLYAMEIGAAGFLGGSVTLRERSVVEVQVPQLK
jgi:hypothetical protein